MSRQRPTTARCCLCGKTKPLAELNGYNPLNNDSSNARCVRLIECDSPEAHALADEVLGWLDGGAVA